MTRIAKDVRCDCHVPLTGVKQFRNQVHAWYCPVAAAHREDRYAEKLRMKRSRAISPDALMNAFVAGEEIQFPSYHEDGRMVVGTIVSLTRGATGLGDDGDGVMYAVIYMTTCGVTRTAYVLADADAARG